MLCAYYHSYDGFCGNFPIISSIPNSWQPLLFSIIFGVERIDLLSGKYCTHYVMLYWLIHAYMQDGIKHAHRVRRCCAFSPVAAGITVASDRTGVLSAVSRVLSRYVMNVNMIYSTTAFMTSGSSQPEGIVFQIQTVQVYLTAQETAGLNSELANQLIGVDRFLDVWSRVSALHGPFEISNTRVKFDKTRVRMESCSATCQLPCAEIWDRSDVD